jgi:hypothetical protein
MPPHPEQTPSLHSDGELESEVMRRIDSSHDVHALSQSHAGQQQPIGHHGPLPTAANSLSDKRSDPLQASRSHSFLGLAGEGQPPFRISAKSTSTFTFGTASFETDGCLADQDPAKIAPPTTRAGVGLDPQAVVVAHAEDLIDTLQRLSEDLDIRSAKLNADIASQERRERAFRLWAQQRAEELRALRDDCERERQQLKAQARRIALAENQQRLPQW